MRKSMLKAVIKGKVINAPARKNDDKKRIVFKGLKKLFLSSVCPHLIFGLINAISILYLSLYN